VRFYPVRFKLKGEKRVSKKKLRVGEVISFVPTSLQDELNEQDRKLISTFNKLPLQRRIYLWQRFIAPFFR
jgi:hypothetical protein